ncbi:efflux RND transporter periplasmic adaptor subunit [Pseudomonas fildesensis]|uniref:Transporter n=1 Tax=Pseudomonas fildesensis TaxID=1674920 RepID=A0A0J8FV23_9PSED|nr:HlyD family efflux transporter periplasmic adaptor subunit [Pseudomonas fildesensis]KMT52203.1 transporter [Pseudomonas fildesensis]
MIIKKYRRWLVALSLLVGLAGLGACLARPSAKPAGDEHWHAVQPEPLVRYVSLVGQIEPYRTVILTAPFDGNVLQRLAHEGQQVAAGQTLLTLDSTLIEIQVREALALQLKAQREVQVFNDWHTGAPVARARRAVRAAQTLVSNLGHRLEESSRLYERGIIARNELDDLKQQVQMQRNELTAAQDELRQVLEQGAGAYRQIAEMELTNATVRYEALRKQLEGGDIRAPFHGVVVPSGIARDAEAGITANVQDGSRVATGQPLFGLADSGQLKVVASVSELDVNQLRAGQAVEVTGDGFEGERLSGSVLAVNSQGSTPEGSGGSATFAVSLSIQALTPEQLQRVRLGMSARLSIATYRNDQALVVPPAALMREGDATLVEYRAQPGQPAQRIVVTTGQSNLQGVEVFGLAPGYVRLMNLRL